jgi:hypothetical protein
MCPIDDTKSAIGSCAINITVLQTSHMCPIDDTKSAIGSCAINITVLQTSPNEYCIF